MAERDGKGRFLQGNTAAMGHGRPRRLTEGAYIQAAVATVSMDDWQEVVEKALQDAKRGNATARRWLSDILIGDEIATRLAALEGQLGIAASAPDHEDGDGQDAPLPKWFDYGEPDDALPA